MRRWCNGMRLLVTRPQADGERTAARLRARGHHVTLAPLLHIEPVDFEFPRAPLSAVVITSANAARAIARHSRREALTALTAFAVGALDLAEAYGARRLGGVAPDRECGQRDERVAPGMARDGARSVRARDHHRAQRLAREFEIDGLDAHERRERDVVAARA